MTSIEWISSVRYRSAGAATDEPSVDPGLPVVASGSLDAHAPVTAVARTNDVATRNRDNGNRGMNMTSR